MEPNANLRSRVIGLDAHPDSFTAALLRGQTPAEAVTEKIFNHVPLAQLARWAEKHTTPEDRFVLEASGNSFQIVRALAAIGRQAQVLESCHMGKLKEAHANNDKISAVRIGKAYLAGTAKIVWVPDRKTQERRDWHHAYGKAVKRTTQTRNRLLSYLSDNGVRFSAAQPLAEGSQAEVQIRQTQAWSTRQWQVIEGFLMDTRHAVEQREHWQSLMAQEVLADELLLSLMRLCGVRDRVAFSLGAIIGDIHRFASPKKLVSYFGLHPAFDDSGENTWRGGLTGHGRKDIRALLIESAHAIMRAHHPLAQWGRKLLARKGAINLVVAAVARRLAVAIWYLMMGKWTTLEEIDSRLARKVGHVITQVGLPRLQALGKTRQALRLEAFALLKTGRTYVLDPHKTMPTPTPAPGSPPAVQFAGETPPPLSPAIDEPRKPGRTYLLQPHKRRLLPKKQPVLGDAVPQTPGGFIAGDAKSQGMPG